MYYKAWRESWARAVFKHLCLWVFPPSDTGREYFSLSLLHGGIATFFGCFPKCQDTILWDTVFRLSPLMSPCLLPLTLSRMHARTWLKIEKVAVAGGILPCNLQEVRAWGPVMWVGSPQSQWATKQLLTLVMIRQASSITFPEANLSREALWMLKSCFSKIDFFPLYLQRILVKNAGVCIGLRTNKQQQQQKEQKEHMLFLEAAGARAAERQGQQAMSRYVQHSIHCVGSHFRWNSQNTDTLKFLSKLIQHFSLLLLKKRGSAPLSQRHPHL